MGDVEKMRALARSLAEAQFVARFPWDFLAVLVTGDDRTLEYSTLMAARAAPTGSGFAEVLPLLKTTATTATAATLVIGRSRGCDVVLSDASVSKVHARMGLSRGRVVTVEDVGSHNGTFVRGEPIPARTAVRVQCGELLRFGSLYAVLLDAVQLHDQLMRG
ncbi:MAG TPA: FHA domain-containing protein [Polyangiaceae bacterium]